MHKLTFATLIDGNMFWNMEVINCNLSSSPAKLFKTTSGCVRYCLSYVFCLFWIETTSFDKLYSRSLKVSVGPCGSRHSLRYGLSSDRENITRWVTWRGPEIETKSLIEFFSETFRLDAVLGSMTLRKSLISSSMYFPTWPRKMTIEWGARLISSGSSQFFLGFLFL